MWYGVHTVKNTVFRILIQNAHFELKFKIRTLPSCENSLRYLRPHCFETLWGEKMKCFSHFFLHKKYCLSNFNSKCAFRTKIQNTHFTVVWKQSRISQAPLFWNFVGKKFKRFSHFFLQLFRILASWFVFLLQISFQPSYLPLEFFPLLFPVCRLLLFAEGSKMRKGRKLWTIQRITLQWCVQ